MNKVRLDRETATLYVGSMVAFTERQATPQYMSLLKFRLAYVDSEIAERQHELDLFEWLTKQPHLTSSEDAEIDAWFIDRATRALAVLLPWRETLLAAIWRDTVQLEAASS